VSARVAFEYAILRVVPRVERGEALNVGVILFAREAAYLGCRTNLDESRLRAFAPALDLACLGAHLAAIQAIADGARDAGPIARFSASERFHWLTAPRSTVLQVSPVHGGLTSDPATTLAHLFQSLVLP